MFLAACLAALLAGQTADTITTVRMLRTGEYREINPLLPPGPVGIVSVKAAMTTTAAVYGWKLRKTRPKLAALIFISGAVGGTVGAWHNMRVWKGRQRYGNR
jgi:uncharacterized membrane protein YfcA